MFAVVAIVLLAACGEAPRPTEDPIDARWQRVQEQFDRLVAFELEFRADARTVAARAEGERLQFVRDALDRRARLQAGLSRELRAFAGAVAMEPQLARLPYSKRVRVEMDKLLATQEGTVPSVKALALDAYEDELSAYQAELDAGLRDAR